MNPETPVSREQDPEADRSLLLQAQSGDTEAFCALTRPLHARLVRQAWVWSGDRHMAEDLAQETLVAAWKSLRRFDGRCRLFTWLCGILIHVHQNARRRKAPASFTGLAQEDGEGVEAWLALLPSEQGTPEERLQQAERHAAVRQCLDRLPAAQRDVVYLRFFVEASLEGIAAALDCPLGTVKSRLFHGLQALATMKDLRRAALPHSDPP